MAIKIINSTPHKSVVKRKVCDNCGVTLKYVPNDIKTETFQTYEPNVFIICTNCNKRIYLS